MADKRIRIHSQFAKSKFLNIEDALAAGKIRLYGGTFANNGGGATSCHRHFLDVADARVLFTDMADGKDVDYTEFKGGNEAGKVVSRRLRINSKRGKDGKIDYFIELSSGPGKRVGAGIVKPDWGQRPPFQLNFFLSGWDARKMAAAVSEYLQAWQTARMILQRKQFSFPEFEMG
ncbi:MAG: hypothetical protein GY803_22345 [Chloroflexi bacterium]|nr:hypothetical protein [Chloroflexota bacterium]